MVARTLEPSLTGDHHFVEVKEFLCISFLGGFFVKTILTVVLSIVLVCFKDALGHTSFRV